MVEKCRVHGFTHLIVSSKGKRKVAHSTAGLGIGQMLLDPCHGTNEVTSIVAMLIDACTNRQDIDVEDDVFGRIADAREQIVGTLGDGYLAFVGRCLTFLVEGHHHDGGTQTMQFTCLCHKVLLSVLEADGINDALALRILQTRDQCVPVARVNHQGTTSDGGVVGNVAQEGLHLRTAIKHGIVHVDVDNLCPTLYLLTSHTKRLVVFLFGNQSGKLA